MSAPFLWQLGYIMDLQYSNGAGPPLRFAFGDNAINGSFTLAQALLGAPSPKEVPGSSLETNRQDAESVTRDQEASSDAASLLAFAKAPHAASLNITTIEYSNRWAYKTKVLPVLAIPLLATFLVCSVYWRVYDDDVVIGYNPVGIAKRADEITTASNGKSDSGDSSGGSFQLKAVGGTRSNSEWECGRLVDREF